MKEVGFNINRLNRLHSHLLKVIKEEDKEETETRVLQCLLHLVILRIQPGLDQSNHRSKAEQPVPPVVDIIKEPAEVLGSEVALDMVSKGTSLKIVLCKRINQLHPLAPKPLCRWRDLQIEGQLVEADHRA